MELALSATRLRLAWSWLAATAVSLALGAAIARGGLMALALATAILGAGLAVLFAELRLYAVLAWLVVSPLAYPFVRYPSDHALLTFDRLWIAALAGAAMLAYRRSASGGGGRLLAIALLWLTLSFGLRAAFSPSPLSGLETWVDAILLPAVLYAVGRAFVESELDVRRLTGALALAGATLAVIGLLGRARGYDLASLTGGGVRVDEEGLLRISGPYPAPEPYALSLVICLAGTLAWLQARRGAGVWLGAAAAALQLSALAFTFFRAAWIGAAIVIAASFGLRPKRLLRTTLIACLVTTTLLGIAALTKHDAALTARIHNTSNIDARLATYLTGVAMFHDAPLAGVGVNEFSNVYESYDGTVVRGVHSLSHPHSSYVGALAEQGIAGFLPLLAATVVGWLLVRRFRRAARSRGDVLLAAAATGAALGYLIMSLTLTMLPYGASNALLALVLGAVAGRARALGASARENEDG